MLPDPPTSSFASDNTSGIVPEVLQALIEVNEGSAIGYGDDPITAKLREEMNELFGREVSTLLAWGGTGANIVGLQAMINSWEAVICSSSSHINIDECARGTTHGVGNKRSQSSPRDGVPAYVSIRRNMLHRTKETNQVGRAGFWEVGS